MNRQTRYHHCLHFISIENEAEEQFPAEKYAAKSGGLYLVPLVEDKPFSPLPSPLQNSQDLQQNVKDIIPAVPYLQEF